MSFPGSCRASATGERKEVEIRAGRTAGQALGAGSEWGHGTGLRGGNSLNPRVYVEIGDPEGTEWKWAEKNGVKGQGGGVKNGVRRPNRLGLEEQGRCSELEEVRNATRRGRRGGAKVGGAERGGDRKQVLVGGKKG